MRAISRLIVASCLKYDFCVGQGFALSHGMLVCFHNATFDSVFASCRTACGYTLTTTRTTMRSTSRWKYRSDIPRRNFPVRHSRMHTPQASDCTSDSLLGDRTTAKKEPLNKLAICLYTYFQCAECANIHSRTLKYM